MLNFRAGYFVMALALPALPALLAPSVASSQTMNANGPRSQIMTTGNGEAHVTPDRATIYIGVQSRAATAATAGADNARKQRAIIDTLKALGFTSEQMSTANYNVSPEISYPSGPGQTPRVTGYTVTNSIRVDVRRLDDIAKAIDGALSKGANEISSLQFYSTKADSARRAALADAVAGARADAEVLARAAGGTLGQLIELATGSEPIRRLSEIMAAPRAMASPAVPTPIEPGQATITATVTARWAFVAK